MSVTAFLVLAAINFCQVLGEGNATIPKPEISRFYVQSDIRFRFAHTLVSTTIVNPANVAQEVYFSAILPDTAFISGFLIEEDDHVYKAHVDKKEAAKQEYKQAVSEGRTAAYVSMSARDSNQFSVSVNVEAKKNVTFNMTYEELLSRTLGLYSDVINLDPGQIVQDFKVVVRINETLDITTLNVPALKTTTQISTNTTSGITNPYVTVKRPTPEEAVITFAPTPDQQRKLATEGIKGQLIVQYDVNRTEHPGQVLVTDGYFVNFFAPTDLPPLNKDVTFVLDISGSMTGRKIEQLIQAMVIILNSLNPGDLFSIVIFSSEVQVWDPTKENNPINVWHPYFWGQTHGDVPQTTPVTPSVVASTTPGNISRAVAFVKSLRAEGSTNIFGALTTALQITQLNITRHGADPIIIFLTDGEANVGISDTPTIVADITKANAGNVSIFSLALGSDADLDLLRKLSLHNTGFARRIYEDSDTALQLRDFYQQLASPLLDHVVFDYEASQVVEGSVTQSVFRRFFAGSELVVAGKLNGDNVTGEVTGTTIHGEWRCPLLPIIIPWPHPINVTAREPSVLERLWAYLTIKQLLKEDEAKDYDHKNPNYTSPEKARALQLALKYSFVTPLTSLVVVKPNSTSAVGTEPATPQNPYYPVMGPMFARSAGISNAFVPYAGFSKVFMGYRVPFIPRLKSYHHHRKTAKGPSLVKMSAIKWLPLNNTNTISLPTGANGTLEVLKISADNQTNVAYASCTTPTNLQGHCRHLNFCSLNVFVQNETQFLPYYCKIPGYVGVCCPDNLQSVVF